MNGESRAQWEQEIDPLQQAVELYRELLTTKDAEQEAFIGGKLSILLPRLDAKDRRQYYDLASQIRREVFPNSCFGSRHLFDQDAKACECGDYFLKRTDDGFEMTIRQPDDEE